MSLRKTAGVLIAAFLAIYVPDLGHGFIKDDFGWIRTSASANLYEFFALFSRSVGFYRPLVSATFAADFAVWGLDPFGYGLTNLLLCIADAVLFFAVVRRFSMGAAAAILATAVWAFNFHGVNMGLLWLSGRTSLLVSAFALATVLAFLSGHRRAAGMLCLAALLCKEEAVMLPAILTGFVLTDDSNTAWRTVVRRAAVTWPLWTALIVYAALRIQTGAMGPLDAPSYYRFSFEPSLVLRNVLEYADRAGTVSVGVVTVLAIVLGRRPSALAVHERRALRLAALWIAGMYALTVFLPVRSSLYALLPSFGSALAVAAFASVVRRTRPDRFRVAAAALLTLLIALIPFYRMRNVRWVELADTSTRVMQTLQFAVSGQPAGGRIVLVDDPQERFNLEAVFGALFPDATRLFFGNRWTGEITHTTAVSPNSNLTYRLEGGTVVPHVGR
ncbi:MAG: hypothetical protein ACRD3C_24145 [Vicinamibacterales bacterium]